MKRAKTLFWLFCVAAFACASAHRASAQKSAKPGTALLPAGEYKPLYREGTTATANAKKTLPVASFYLDEYPVTNADYLAFAREHPAWRRSRVKRIFADSRYLSAWRGDLDFGDTSLARTPAVSVSWFAAAAYCRSKGKRLPTIAEWEYAGAASETAPNATDDPAFIERILRWYGKPQPERLPPVGSGVKNFFGVSDMHGVVWEWTEDFNTALVTGESRADSGLERDLFCGAGSTRASDFKDYAAFMRFGFRTSLKANYTVSNLGFRCACDADKTTTKFSAGQ